MIKSVSWIEGGSTCTPQASAGPVWWWRLWRASAASVAVALAACGGGGSGGAGSTPAPVNPPSIATQPRAVTVAAGQSATFSVTASGDGTLTYQWSRNGTAIGGATAAAYVTGPAQLSDDGASFSVAVSNSGGTTTSVAAALTVTPVAAVVTSQVAAGAAHSLALKSDGSVWSWGDNANGQLGVGASVPFTFTPSHVLQANGSTLTGIASLVAGDQHSLAVGSDGVLLAWGRNAFGQLGDGTATTRANPVQVVDSGGNAFGNVAQAGAGQGISAALRRDGTVWVWGFYAGVTNTVILRPTQVLLASGAALTGVTRIAVGAGAVLAIKSDGSLWAWGLHGNGATGLSTTAVPVETAPGVALSGIVDAAIGRSNAAAVATDGRVFTWGTGFLGRTASLTTGVWAGPVTDSGGTSLTGVVHAAVGQDYSVLLRSDGSMLAFGTNGNGALGANSTNTFETWPVVVKDAAGVAFGSVQQLSLFSEHVLLVRDDGSAWGWGRNANVQLARAPNPPLSYFYLNPISIAF